jgi:D-alanyl-lipoteichoic acid acyltransferase DltB (MBOAT superfamily)
MITTLAHILTPLASLAQGLAQYLAAPVSRTDWLVDQHVGVAALFDERYVVCWFAPLLPILLFLQRDRLRVGIICTGLIFLAYVFGVAYAVFWLLNAVLFYWLAEWFARECRRTDVLPIGPPLAAILIITTWHVGTMLLHEIELPATLNTWLFEHARWLYPLGTRDLPWEPRFPALFENRHAPGPAQPLYALFWNIHNIGTAYFTVRMLHYFSDIKRGTLPAERRTPLNFLAYVCYAPNLIQGPIERFLPFQDEMNDCHTRRRWSNLPPALLRIGLGLLKGIVATWYVSPFLAEEMGVGSQGATFYEHPAEIESTLVLYFGVAVHLSWLYLLFSGYCDISAGFARLLGYRQAENFDKPWLSTSLRDFWRRWHLTLSFILRDYIYIALGGNRRHVPLNICITFFLCGIWHWLMVQVGIWGIAMGLLVTANHYWVHFVKWLDEHPDYTWSRLRQRWIKIPILPTLCAWLITQHAFMWTILILFGGGAAYRVPFELLRRLSAWITG